MQNLLTRWKREGVELAHNLNRDIFAIGDWYLRGQQEFGRGAVKAIVEAPDWRGLEYPTIKIHASVARCFPPPFRHLNVSPSHYQEATALAREKGLDVAIELLQRAAAANKSSNWVRIEARRIRFWRPTYPTGVVSTLDGLIAQGRRFRGGLADPPWRWERTQGKKGSSDPYYPTMPLDELCALRVAEVVTDDSFMFLWVPAAALPEAIELLRAWGYKYKTCACWDKMSGGFGIGDYWRMEHELLILGVRPQSQTHFDDRDMSSMIRAKRSRNHSQKPEIVHSMIERAIGGPWLELFGRRRVDNWMVVGNQLPPLVEIDAD